MGTIVQRIKKLLALALHPNTGAEEAAVAMAKAQALLYEHNISTIELEAATGKQAEAFMRDHITIGGAPWQEGYRKTLAHVVAKYNFCKTVYLAGERKSALFGKPSNVEVVKYLYETVLRQIEKLANEWHKAKGSHEYSTRADFCYGAVRAIEARLKPQSEAQATQAMDNKATSLALLDHAKQLEAFWRRDFPKT